jgi:STE24 endopeptidase
LITALDVFPPEQIERARRYHRPLYVALALDLALSLAVLVLLVFTGFGGWLFGLVDGIGWLGETIAFTALVVLLTAAVRLPVSFWRGYLHERRWGFSTQTLGGWVGDRAKGIAIELVLSLLTVVGVVAIARGFPTWWPLVAAVAGALGVLLIGFVAPVLLEPVFNKFRPLGDAALAEDLRTLAQRAGAPVRDVLVADASKRTKKVNAYVSGFGATRRVVLFDTLVDRGEPQEVKLVVAHELGHRRARHVIKATVLAMAAVALATVIIWLLLRSGGVRDAAGVSGAGDPRLAPFVFLVGVVLELIALPFGTALSRRWEREADRFSLDVTKDVEAFEAAHRDLAMANLSDLDPPRPIYLLLSTHPTPPERIASARRWETAT